MTSFYRSFNFMKKTHAVMKQAYVQSKRLAPKHIARRNFSKGSDDLTLLAIRDLSHQRVACRNVSKRCPSVSVTLSRNNCVVREPGRASLATAAADSSTKGLACVETVDGVITGAKALSLVGVDDDGK
eukprot:jgi/Galph1/767/GphlegSOOS_G5488.1